MARAPIRKPTAITDNLIADVVEGMEKEFGKGAALTPNSKTVLCRVDHWVSTRNFLIDSAIAGGLPMPRPIVPFGRLTEISGLNSTGKTSLMGQIMAETQAQGGIAAIIDSEQALDLPYFEKLGVNLDKLILTQCETIEEVFTRAMKLIKIIKNFKEDVPLICIGWDSLGGTPTKDQLEADADDKFYAAAAKVVGMNLQRIMQTISKEKIAFVVNNHLYRKMNVQYGDPWETYGGEKIKFFSTLRIRLEHFRNITEKEDDENSQILGQKIKIKILKNKMTPVLKTVVVPCLGGHGFSMDYAIMEQAQKVGAIAKKGAWKSWTTPKGITVTFQNWEDFQAKVMAHDEYPDLVQQVVSQYYQQATNQ